MQSPFRSLVSIRSIGSGVLREGPGRRVAALAAALGIGLGVALAPLTPVHGGAPQVLALAVSANGQNVYAGMAGGIYASADAGNTWTAKTTGLQNVTVNALAVDPTNPSNVYAGTSGGFFKSSDAGNSWTASNGGLTNTTILAVAIDSTHPTTIHIGTTTNEFNSVDSGGTWTPAGASIQGQTVRALLVDPANGNNVYGGTATGGVFLSTDAGATWNQVNNGLGSLGVNGLTLDPSHTITIHAATDGGEYNSTNYPTSWTAGTGLPASTRVLSIVEDPFPGQTTTIYAGLVGAGVYKSTDAGGTWQYAGGTNTANTIYALAEQSYAQSAGPSGSDIVFAGTDGGVLASADGGQTWVGHPLPALEPQLAVSPGVVSFVTDFTGTVAPGPRTLTLSDPNNVGYTWMVSSITSAGYWLTIATPNGTVASGAGQTSSLVVRAFPPANPPARPAPGLYTGQLVISTSAPAVNSPMTITVTILVPRSQVFLPLIPNDAQ